MVEPDELACSRAAVEAEFQDFANLPTSVRTPDGRGGWTSVETPGDDIPALLSRMSVGEEKVVADRLQGRAGYRLKVSYTVDPTQTGDVIVNTKRFEIVAGFGGEARSTHTKFLLAKYS